MDDQRERRVSSLPEVGFAVSWDVLLAEMDNASLHSESRSSLRCTVASIRSSSERDSTGVFLPACDAEGLATEVCFLLVLRDIR